MNINIDKQILGPLNDKGYVHLKSVLSEMECTVLRAMYDKPNNYRSVINMERYRFGKGEYKYFNYPLPGLLNELDEEAGSWYRLSLDP